MVRIFALLLVLSPSFLLIGCESTERQRPVLQFDRTNPAPNGSRFPYLHTTDGHTLYMSWLTRIEEGMAAIEYARYRDGVWESPRTIHVGNDLHLSWESRPTLIPADDAPPSAGWVRLGDAPESRPEARIALPAERYWDHHAPFGARSGTIREAHALAGLADGRMLAYTFEHSGTGYGQGLADGRFRTVLTGPEGETESDVVSGEVIISCGPPALHTDGREVLAAHRSWYEDEHRLALTRWDGGEELWQPLAVLEGPRWEDPACPAAPPALAGDPSGYAVAWFEGGENPAVRLAIGDENGLADNSHTLSLGQPAGRVAVTRGPYDAYYVVWMEIRGELAHLYLQIVKEGEPLEQPIRLGATDADEASGIPALAPMERMLVVAWTQTTPFYRVRTVHYPWPQDDAEIH